eukprot:3201378-Pyramimonas_sp.AAC.1
MQAKNNGKLPALRPVRHRVGRALQNVFEAAISQRVRRVRNAPFHPLMKVAAAGTDKQIRDPSLRPQPNAIQKSRI